MGGKHNAVLMISLVWRNRAIPIIWLVKKGGKDHFKTVDHLQVIREVIKILKSIIPLDIPVTLLGDGVPIAIGIDSIDIQQLCWLIEQFSENLRIRLKLWF